jgi:hypothetical protein
VLNKGKKLVFVFCALYIREKIIENKLPFRYGGGIYDLKKAKLSFCD